MQFTSKNMQLNIPIEIRWEWPLAWRLKASRAFYSICN